MCYCFFTRSNNIKSKTVLLSFCPKHYYTTEILFGEALDKTGTTPLYQAFPVWPIWMIGIAVCTW